MEWRINAVILIHISLFIVVLRLVLVCLLTSYSLNGTHFVPSHVYIFLSTVNFRNKNNNKIISKG